MPQETVSVKGKDNKNAATAKAGRPPGRTADPAKRFRERANVTYRLALSVAKKCEGMQGQAQPSAEERAKVVEAIKPALERAIRGLDAFAKAPEPGAEDGAKKAAASVF